MLFGRLVGRNAATVLMLLWPFKMLKLSHLYLGRQLMIQRIQRILMIQMIKMIQMIQMIQMLQKVQKVQRVLEVQRAQKIQKVQKVQKVQHTFWILFGFFLDIF